MRDFRVLFIVLFGYMSGCSPEVTLDIPPALAEKLAGNGGVEDMLPMILEAMRQMQGNNLPPENQPQTPDEQTPITEEQPAKTPGEAVSQPPKEEPTPAEVPKVIDVCEGQHWQDRLDEFEFHAHGFEARAEATFRLDPATGITITPCLPARIVLRYYSGTTVRAEIEFFPAGNGYNSFRAQSYGYDGQFEVEFAVEQGQLKWIYQTKDNSTIAYEATDDAADGIYMPMLPEGPFQSSLLKLALKSETEGDADGFAGATDSYWCQERRIVQLYTDAGNWPPTELANLSTTCENHVETRLANMTITGILNLAGHYDYYELNEVDEGGRPILRAFYSWNEEQAEIELISYEQTTYATDDSGDYEVFNGLYTLIRSTSISDDHRFISMLHQHGDDAPYHVSMRNYYKGKLIDQFEFAPRITCLKGPFDCQYGVVGVSDAPQVKISWKTTEYGYTTHVFDGPLAIAMENPTETFSQNFIDIEQTKLKNESHLYVKPVDGTLGPLLRPNMYLPIQGYSSSYAYTDEVLTSRIVYTLEQIPDIREEYQYHWLGMM